MPSLNTAKYGAIVLLIIAANRLPLAESSAKESNESTAAETSVVNPDGVSASGSGRAMPSQVSGGKVNTAKRVKARDIAKPGTGAHTIREFEEKTQKEFFQNRQGFLSELKDAELSQSFDKNLKWSCLRYPIWPIAMNINQPLQTNNIFVLDRNNKIVALIGDTDKLKAFCAKNLLPVMKEPDAKNSLIAYLRLQQELAQDGMFQFSIKQESLKISRSANQIVASGRSIVAPNTGNEGYLESRLVFSADGKLLSADSVNKLQEGMRPICQSTKLLDPDPIVRKMAEQDILLMGKSCKFYLDDIRSRAKPEVKEAIDNIWKRIEEREVARQKRDCDGP